MSGKGLADYLRAEGVVGSDEIYEAFAAVDRGDFMPEGVRFLAAADQALSIGCGQTISQPFTVAFMLNLLDVRPGQKVLDVGSGSGWTTALLAHLVGKKGKVTGLELVPELVEFGHKNVAKYDFTNAEIRQADPEVLGLPNEAPFDRILVSAAADSMPNDLLEQLKPGGIMVLPIKNSIIKAIKSRRGKIETKESPGFVFVPLITR